MIRTADERLAAEAAAVESRTDVLSRICRRSMFWVPERVAPVAWPSAWAEHVPFAFWLVDVLRPSAIVELGTENGVSYSAWCQAVKTLHLPTRCFAVDTWKGDEHTGFYPEEIFKEFSEFNDARYGAFSRLVRSTFAEAVPHFEDQSVDLLHIDGLHSYEAVRRDFESWAPKLTPDAIVVLHDVNVRERGFGVFRLWTEISRGHSHFTFLHGHGLGILGLGTNYPRPLQDLFEAGKDEHLAASIRETFARLGRSVALAQDLNRANAALANEERQISSLNQALSERDGRIATHQSQVDRHRVELAERDKAIAALSGSLSQRDGELNGCRAALAEQQVHLIASNRALGEHGAEIAVLRTTLSERNNQITALQAAEAQLRASFTDRERLIPGLQEVIAAREDEIGTLRAAVADRDAAASSLSGTLAARNGEIAVLTATLSDRDAELAAVRAILSEHSTALQAMLASTSWRLAAPVRLTRRGLRHIGNGDLIQSLMLPWRVLRTRSRAPIRAWRAVRIIRRSSLFDSRFYLENNRDVAAQGLDPIRHYVAHGAAESRDPSAAFSTAGYLANNPDVATAGINPLVHYILHGSAEARHVSRRPIQVAGTEIKPFPGTVRSRASFGGVRVIAISHNFNHEGAPNSQLELITGLQGRGLIDPIVLSPHDGPLRAAYEAKGITTEVVTPPDLTSVEAFENTAAAMAKAFRQSGAQVVYANTLQAFWAIAVAERAGLPAIWNIRESESWETYFDYLRPEIRPIAYGAFDWPYRIIFVAQATQRAWEPARKRDNFRVIHNGLDAARLRLHGAESDRAAIRADLQIADSELAVLLLGTVCERKGQLDLVAAAAGLPKHLVPAVRILIVGDRPGPYSTRLHAQVQALPRDRQERFRIVPETNDPYPYLKAADIALCCSRIESYPRVTLEAMAFGLPIITTPVYGIAEQVREGENALLYQPGDIGQLVKHLTHLVANGQERARMGTNSGRVLANLPSYADMLDAYGRDFAAAAQSAPTSFQVAAE